MGDNDQTMPTEWPATDAQFLDAIGRFVSARRDEVDDADASAISLPVSVAVRLLSMASGSMGSDIARYLDANRSKYTRWVDGIGVDGIYGILWLLGEARVRLSSRELDAAGLRVSTQVGGQRRAMAALHALISWSPERFSGEAARKEMRNALRNQNERLREQLVEVRDKLVTHGGREEAHAMLLHLIHQLDDASDG